MPKASDHQSSSIVKLLYIGDSSTGKTTSLASLVRAGFKLRIYDYDNLLSPLIAVVKRDCPENLDNIEFMSFRDRFKATPSGPICDGLPTAFVDGLRALDKWEDGSKPAEWGSDFIVVVDSLTTLARAAYFWARGMSGAAGIPEGVATKGFSPQNAYHTGQQGLMNIIAYLTSDWFRVNVIVVAHIKYLEHDGAIKGFPISLGTAIAPEIPTYFPAIALATKTGEKRIIRTCSTNLIDLKNPRSFEKDWENELPMEDGLAKYFERTRT
jgi:GTPase SAR1 family protein